jgi:hypothetical protein
MEMVINRRTDVLTTYKSIRNLSACVEKRGRVGIGGCSLGGESWDGEEEGEIKEERVGRVCIYWLLSMESPTDMSHR